MNPSLAKIFFIAGSRLRGTPVMRWLYDLDESQWWSLERLESLQLERLNGLLRHARENSEFYGKLLGESGIGDRISSLDELAALPPVSKAEIKKNFAGIQNGGRGGRLIRSKTAGSTGEPLVFYRGAEWDAQHRAAMSAALAWAAW